MQNSIHFWDNHYTVRNSAQSPFAKELHELIISLIPENVKSILDAGCGGGVLMAKLAYENKWELSGIDLSHNGVKYITDNLNLEAQQGSITKMPYEDNYFDLVICSEVIDNLSNEDIHLALKELYRVSKKYLVISTPYKEDLGYHQVKCMNCKSTFHGGRRLQSFEESFYNKVFGSNAKSVKFYYSGKREFRSTYYADFIRSINNNIIFIEGERCPFCSTEIDKIKLSLNNIICLVEK